MYNYLKDKYLTEVYKKLKKNNMYEDFIKDVVLETEEYKKLIKKLQKEAEAKKSNKNSEK